MSKQKAPPEVYHVRTWVCRQDILQQPKNLLEGRASNAVVPFISSSLTKWLNAEAGKGYFLERITPLTVRPGYALVMVVTANSREAALLAETV